MPSPQYRGSTNFDLATIYPGSRLYVDKFGVDHHEVRWRGASTNTATFIGTLATNLADPKYANLKLHRFEVTETVAPGFDEVIGFFAGFLNGQVPPVIRKTESLDRSTALGTDDSGDGDINVNYGTNLTTVRYATTTYPQSASKASYHVSRFNMTPYNASPTGYAGTLQYKTRVDIVEFVTDESLADIGIYLNTESYEDRLLPDVELDPIASPE